MSASRKKETPARESNREQNNNMDDRIKELKEGDLVVTPGGNIYDLQEPSWLDKEKFYRAGKVYKTHFGGVNFGHLCGLLLSFYFTKNIETLKSTGWSANTKKLFKRYIATVRHVQSWYEGDVWDVDHPSRRSLFIVRSMHERVANKMAITKQNGIVYVSQWDMALTQWAFIGPILLFPGKLGLQCCTKDDFECLIHFWRAVGYLLGIEDKYNLCTGTYADVIKACKRLRNEYREKVIIANPTSTSMAESVVVAFKKMEPVFTWAFLANYIHTLVDVPCPIKMGILDYICYNFVYFMMTVINSYSFTRLLLNEFSRWKLEKADEEVKTFEKLKINVK